MAYIGNNGLEGLKLSDQGERLLPHGPAKLGDLLPNFTARTTQGIKSLTDFRGKWLILFSHPADFTPVCTSEFVAIAHAADRFAALDCQLMALSVDSLFSHFAWIKAIHQAFDVKVMFPLIEDPTLEIAHAYGMVDADSLDASSVRTSYFIDPDGRLRASTCYPANVGRSVEEMLRLLAGLQRADGQGALVPADWGPGDDLLAVPSQTLANVFAAPSATAWLYAPVPDKG
ncbi:peroxiredoxin [Sphingomonas sp. 28-63-12]|uniref:peroxiredoxin n=1 Tax=Sphingomonas sp. 28-63-12 TaxID=1970434 RepID=UPI000BCB4643|nr:MAG: peroxiredoxin [Sphingomonas sp. 28-63-12]